MTLRKLTLDECEVRFECLDECESPEGYFASGSKEQDAATCQDIRERLESGNPWAWFCAMVTVRWRGIESDPEYLGACSYESEADFRRDGYFADMVKEALANLNDRVAERVKEADDIRAFLEGEEVKG